MARLPSTAKAVAEAIIDPVCGMKVPPGKTELVVQYQGCNYTFCAEACRVAFEKDPQKYLGRKSPKRKGWFGRYLERMAKANKKEFGGGGAKCH